ncbi:partner and localizer of BRCA2 isoform X3 [Thalassophryne amazonica]|uniref:partner and localizer of BRCA2 isoform X3 n=1 Tax=Thalassophryne amazonica TaxID=390379 RepID=UPI001470E210|nr:partner and localizer of BRCA2 isoform X3 [Thalassophryne amazonica]
MGRVSIMEKKVGEDVDSDDLLKTSLHCDDKDKLRRKLALLQKEYLRTARRLKRAERLEAVRKHVRNRITEQNHQNQGCSGGTSNPLLQTSSSSRAAAETTAAFSECQGLSGDPAGEFRRTQTIKFLLPSDAACTPPPDASLDPAGNHKASPALRLRSRSSRLRWEKRTAEASRSTDNSEDGLEQSGRTEGVRSEGEEGKVKSEGAEVIKESEEITTALECESPSVLLPHWNTCGGAGETEAQEKQGGQQHQEQTEKRDSVSASSPLMQWSPAVNTEGRQIHEESRQEKPVQQQRGDMEQTQDSTLKIKDDKDTAGKNLMDSCTVVEGLLYPAEYYIRTTRRMTSAQSQPNVQAIVLSQFSQGRGRRRGRGRGFNTNRCSDQHTQTDSSLLSEPASSGSRVHFDVQALDKSAVYENQTPEQTNTEARLVSTLGTCRPVRSSSRRRRRGRGRGTCLAARHSSGLETPPLCSKQTSDDSQPLSGSVDPSVSSSGAEGLKTEVAAPVPDDPQPLSPRATDAQSSSGVNGTPSSTTSCHLKNIHPIFSQRSCQTTRSMQMETDWRLVRLPSSSPAENSLLPSSLFDRLVNFDIQQDFHLPDDQFASLKLHKLRQVAVELELFTSPSYNTRSSSAVTPLPFTLSLTPTVQSLPPTTGESLNQQSSLALSQTSPGSMVAPQSVHQSAEEHLSDGDTTEAAEENRDENICTNCQTLTRSSLWVSAVPECVDNSVDQCEEPNPQSSHIDDSLDVCVVPQPDLNCTVQLDQPFAEQLKESVVHSDKLQIKPASDISEQQTDCLVEDQQPTHHQTEDGTLMEDLSYLNCPPEENTADSNSCCTTNCAALKTSNDSEADAEKSAIDSKCLTEEHCETSTDPPEEELTESKNEDKCSPHRNVHSELLLSPSITPHTISSAVPSSPPLPSLGLTPNSVTTGQVLTSPSLHKPSTPPAQSPCPSLTSALPRLPPVSFPDPIQGFLELPAPCPTVTAVQETCTNERQCVEREAGIGHVVTTEETAKEDIRPTHTLKAPAGGSLVDACCLLGSSGALYVAAAGKWAVCIWSQTSPSDWSLMHTWTFSKPVINVFSVPDAVDLMYVTLGQLEIREVRILSCSTLSDVLLCEGVVQAVVGVPKSRVVSSSHSATGSVLQVFTLSDSRCVHSSQLLVSPGVCVRALAPVERLSDALIGTDEAGHVFVWNLRSGQLLRRMVLGEGLLHSACLRGYSCSGVLFVLLQHHFLSSLEDKHDTEGKEESLSQEERQQEKKTALFSLIAMNPLNGKSVLATRLYPHKSWTGRLCEADVSGSAVVGLSQTGCVCVWDVSKHGGVRMVKPTDRDGWLLARWGERDTLVTGHHSGNVTLHYCTELRASALLTNTLV